MNPSRGRLKCDDDMRNARTCHSVASDVETTRVRWMNLRPAEKLTPLLAQWRKGGRDASSTHALYRLTNEGRF